MKANIILIGFVSLIFLQGCSKLDKKPACPSADASPAEAEIQLTSTQSNPLIRSDRPAGAEIPMPLGTPQVDNPPEAQEASLSSAYNGAKILAFGDFGTGGTNQTVAAQSMIEFCQSKKCDFGLSVGDNIYPSGLESLTNGKVDWEHGKPDYNIIKNLFVDKYSPLNIPIFMSFGNHDIGDIGGFKDKFKDVFKSRDYINKRTSALMMNQISYSNHPENPVLGDTRLGNKRLWNFPGQFYDLKVQKAVRLWAIDTNTYPHRALDERNQVDPEAQNFKQKTWLDEQLSQSSADWKIVYGHIPLYTHGKHGWQDPWVANGFRASIINSLCEHKVDFYIAGHEHMLEVDQHRCENGHLLTAIITGAAAKGTKVQSLSFPLTSTDENLLWANGKHFAGDKTIYNDDEPTVGFAYFDLIDATQAIVRMKLSKETASQKDGCFKIVKGVSIAKTQCE